VTPRRSSSGLTEMSLGYGPQTLAELLTAAAHGRFPPADGTLALTLSPAPYRRAVVAFTAHC